MGEDVRLVRGWVWYRMCWCCALGGWWTLRTAVAMTMVRVRRGESGRVVWLVVVVVFRQSQSLAFCSLDTGDWTPLLR